MKTGMHSEAGIGSSGTVNPERVSRLSRLSRLVSAASTGQQALRMCALDRGVPGSAHTTDGTQSLRTIQSVEEYASRRRRAAAAMAPLQ